MLGPKSRQSFCILFVVVYFALIASEVLVTQLKLMNEHFLKYYVK